MPVVRKKKNIHYKICKFNETATNSATQTADKITLTERDSQTDSSRKKDHNKDKTFKPKNIGNYQ